MKKAPRQSFISRSSLLISGRESSHVLRSCSVSGTKSRLSVWLAVCLIASPTAAQITPDNEMQSHKCVFCFVLFIPLTNSDIIEPFDNEKDFLDLIFQGFSSLIHLTVQAASGSQYIPEAHDINIL